MVAMCSSGLGLPIELQLTAGQRADVTRGEALLKGYQPKAVIADKGYDSDALVESIEASGAEAVIPSKQNRTEPRAHDPHLYKERNLVERFMNRIKQYRRVATRYEKKARSFLGFVHVASIMVLLLYSTRAHEEEAREQGVWKEILSNSTIERNRAIGDEGVASHAGHGSS
jgi:transposase